MAAGTDRQVHQVTLPVDLGLHQPATRAALDHRVGEFLLSVHELVLHLLRCREQLLHIDLAARIHCALTRYRQPASSRAATGTPAAPARSGPPDGPVGFEPKACAAPRAHRLANGVARPE